MPDQPLVSILCISMNHEAFIEKSFRSVIHQAYPNIEILYLDNASSDQSFTKGKAILESSNANLKAYQRERSFGISANINYLLKEANGKYITIISADDWWEPENLQKKISFFEKHQRYGLLHGAGYIYHYATGKTEIEQPLNTSSGMLLKRMLERNFVNTVGVVIRKAVFDDVGIFDEDSPIEDWDMWIRIAEKYPILFFPEPLVYYGKRSGENLSDNRAFMKNGYQYIFNKYSHHPEINKARQYYFLEEIYFNARQNPDLKNLVILLKNFKLTWLHFTQVARCIAGMAGVLRR